MLIVYWKPTCPWAGEVRDLLARHAIAYEPRDIIANAEYFKEMVQKTGQEKSPCVELDGEIIADVGGSEVAEWLVKKGLIEEGGASAAGGASKTSCSLH